MVQLPFSPHRNLGFWIWPSTSSEFEPVKLGFVGSRVKWSSSNSADRRPRLRKFWLLKLTNRRFLFWSFILLMIPHCCGRYCPLDINAGSCLFLNGCRTCCVFVFSKEVNGLQVLQVRKGHYDSLCFSLLSELRGNMNCKLQLCEMSTHLRKMDDVSPNNRDRPLPSQAVDVIWHRPIRCKAELSITMFQPLLTAWLTD